MSRLLLLFGGSAVAEVEIRRLREKLREKDGISAAPERRKNAMLMAVDVRSIFEEGHRYIQQKMRLKVCLWGFRRERKKR